MPAGIELYIGLIGEVSTNATFAGVMTVLLGVLLARREYIKQQNVDRESIIKKEISDDILLLQAKLHCAIIIVDRIAYSWSVTAKKPGDFLEEVIESEIPLLSKLINEEIPFLEKKIASGAEVYFNDRETLDTFNNWGTELKKIHDTFVSMNFDIKRKTNEQEQLSSDSFDEGTKTLMKKIWASRTIYT